MARSGVPTSATYRISSAAMFFHQQRVHASSTLKEAHGLAPASPFPPGRHWGSPTVLSATVRASTALLPGVLLRPLAAAHRPLPRGYPPFRRRACTQRRFSTICGSRRTGQSTPDNARSVYTVLEHWLATRRMGKR